MSVFTAAYPKQKEFLDSDARVRGFAGGRGTGKTTIGAIDLLNRAVDGGYYVVATPSRAIMIDATMPVFESIAREQERLIGFTKGIDQREYEIKTKYGGKSTVVFLSTAEFIQFNGPALTGAWVDEIGLMDQTEGVNVLISLAMNGDDTWLSSTFTPQGTGHWSYSLFFDIYGTIRTNMEIITSTTGENPFLPAGYADMISETMKPELARQELNGEFVEPGDE